MTPPPRYCVKYTHFPQLMYFYVLDATAEVWHSTPVKKVGDVSISLRRKMQLYRLVYVFTTFLRKMEMYREATQGSLKA